MNGEAKELPQSAFEFLLKLWARSHNQEIVNMEYREKDASERRAS